MRDRLLRRLFLAILVLGQPLMLSTLIWPSAWPLWLAGVVLGATGFVGTYTLRAGPRSAETIPPAVLGEALGVGVIYFFVMAIPISVNNWTDVVHRYAGAAALILLVVIVAYVLGSPSTDSREFLRPSVFRVGLLVGSCVLAFPLAGKHASPNYYETVAQIIPVIFLVLAVEGRSFQLTQGIIDRVAGFATLIMLLIAEGAAIYATAADTPIQGTLAVTAIGVAAGFLAVGHSALLGLLGPTDPPDPPHRAWRKAEGSTSTRL